MCTVCYSIKYSYGKESSCEKAEQSLPRNTSTDAESACQLARAGGAAPAPNPNTYHPAAIDAGHTDSMLIVTVVTATALTLACIAGLVLAARRLGSGHYKVASGEDASFVKMSY